MKQTIEAWTRIDISSGRWPKVHSGNHPLLYLTRKQAESDKHAGTVVRRVTVTFEVKL